MNFKTFILMILFSYLRFVSGQSQYLQLYSHVYSYYGSPNDYQYPSYSVPYYSSYVIPTYYSSYVIPTYYSQYQQLPNTTLTNSTANSPIIQQSSSIINNITDFISIYTIVFFAMIIDMIMNI
jgi:hypothetical protein